MIKNCNTDIRLRQAQRIEFREMWHDMLFTDETTVAQEHYTRLGFSKKDLIVAKSTSKYPLKLHAKGMISCHSFGPLVILWSSKNTSYYGIMDRLYFETSRIKEVAAPHLGTFSVRSSVLIGQ